MDRGILGIGVCTLDVLTKISSFPEDVTTFYQPAYSVPLTVNTMGCDDVYHGAFLNSILRNLTVKESAKMASAAGSLNAMKIGGRGNLVNHDRLDIFLEEAKEIESKP